MDELDLRGLRCPLPALHTEKRLRGLSPGQRLCVLADDPLAAIDIPHLCRQGGHTLLGSDSIAGHHRFVIAKAGDDEASPGSK